MRQGAGAWVSKKAWKRRRMSGAQSLILLLFCLLKRPWSLRRERLSGFAVIC
jgi:hypothetical protein